MERESKGKTEQILDTTGKITLVGGIILVGFGIPLGASVAFVGASELGLEKIIEDGKRK